MQIQTTKRKAHNRCALRDTGMNTTWPEKYGQNAKCRAADKQHKVVSKHTDHRWCRSTAHCTHREKTNIQRTTHDARRLEKQTTSTPKCKSSQRGTRDTW